MIMDYPQLKSKLGQTEAKQNVRVNLKIVLFMFYCFITIKIFWWFLSAPSTISQKNCIPIPTFLLYIIRFLFMTFWKHFKRKLQKTLAWNIFKRKDVGLKSYLTFFLPKYSSSLLINSYTIKYNASNESHWTR